jgi:hypothetical protein
MLGDRVQVDEGDWLMTHNHHTDFVMAVGEIYLQLDPTWLLPIERIAQNIVPLLPYKYRTSDWRSVSTAITKFRHEVVVPDESYAADIANGSLQKSACREKCPHCKMILYYRMQKGNEYIKSWHCLFCKQENYEMDWTAKRNIPCTALPIMAGDDEDDE